MCAFLLFSFLSYRLHVKGFNVSVKLIGFLSECQERCGLRVKMEGANIAN